MTALEKTLLYVCVGKIAIEALVIIMRISLTVG